MSTWAKWVVVIAVLAFLVPFMILFLRRWRRGELRDSGINSSSPPSGPDIGAT